MKFPRPEAFDILGIFVFSFFMIVSARALLFSESLPEWFTSQLFIIGVLGLLIDGSIVYKTYLKK